MIDILIWINLHPGVHLELEKMPVPMGHFDDLVKLTMTSDNLGKAKCVAVVSLNDLAVVDKESIHDYITYYLDGMYTDMLDAKRQEFEMIVDQG